MLREFLKLMFSVLLILFSIPSFNADLEFWITLINLQSWKWWNYLLAAVGAILFLNAMFNFYSRFNTENSENKKDILPHNGQSICEICKKSV